MSWCVEWNGVLYFYRWSPIPECRFIIVGFLAEPLHSTLSYIYSILFYSIPLHLCSSGKMMQQIGFNSVFLCREMLETPLWAEIRSILEYCTSIDYYRSSSHCRSTSFIIVYHRLLLFIIDHEDQCVDSRYHLMLPTKDPKDHVAHARCVPKGTMGTLSVTHGSDLPRRA